MTTSLRQTRGARIQALRKEQRYSQRALARETGISQAHLWRVERGLCDVSLGVLERIAAVLEVRVAELFEEQS